MLSAVRKYKHKNGNNYSEKSTLILLMEENWAPTVKYSIDLVRVIQHNIRSVL